MNDIRHQPIDTAALNANQFTWTGKKGVADVSDFIATDLTAFFPTAIRLHSNRTGQDKLFHFVTAAYNDEDEIAAWIYQSEDHFDIHLLND